MKNILKYSLLLPLFIFNKIEAQQVTKTDTLQGTPLSITADRKVLSLMEDLEEYCDTKKTIRKNAISSDEEKTTSKPSTKVVASRALTTSEICRNNPRILGVKIQLTVVKSNDEANEVKAYFRRRFPNIKVETDASLRPNYKILAGSYFNKQSAASDLARIREYFKSATTIQYRVFCVEAK